jgi:hypothetical protein
LRLPHLSDGSYLSMLGYGKLPARNPPEVSMTLVA